MTRNKTTVEAKPGSFDIQVTREFDAACELVFRAHVDPELFSRWYGCREMSVQVEQFDVRTGGTYVYLQRIGSAPETVGRGVFHEVIPNYRIVQTFESEARPGGVVLETIRFLAISLERTRITKQLVFQSVQDRDALVELGVERGTSESLEKLDAVLASLASPRS